MIYYPELDEGCHKEVLENGLTVAVVPRKGFTKKLAYFVTDYGAIHTDFTLEGTEYHAPAGVAHYLEHKLFDMPGGRDVSAEFAALGAMTNAFTSYDLTAYYFSCTENFSDCLRLLLEFVSTPYFTKESVEKERGIIDQEIGMNQDAPDSVIFENLMVSMYENHPIQIPILGTSQTIREITTDTLNLCHRAFYTPGNMLLCVVGDVVPESVCAAALDILGPQPRPVAQKTDFPAEPEHCTQALCRAEMDIAMPTFCLGFKCPDPGKGEAAIRAEIVGDLAAELLFGESSTLYLQLYADGRIDSSFGGGYEAIDGCAMLSCGGDSEHAESIRDAIFARAAEISREGLTEEDLRRMKRSAMGRRIRDLDSFDSTCFRLCAYTLSDFDYFRFPSVYDSIRPTEIVAFIADTVQKERCSLSIIDPPKEETYAS